MDAKLDYDKLYEIRLRVGRPLFLTYDGGECFLRKPGQEQYLVTTEDLKETLEYVTGYSLYAYEDEIRQGFISVQGGHRVGVTGKVVLDRGRIMGMKYISCINVRLALYPPECLEYVVVHELCHLRERGHGQRFKDLMDTYMPDWRERRAKLR